VLIANWAGVMARLAEPAPSRDAKAILANWAQHRDALKIALGALAKVPATPKPDPPQPRLQLNAPVAVAPTPPPTQESQLLAAIELIARLMEMLCQQMLEISLDMLERNRDPAGLRELQSRLTEVAGLMQSLEALPPDRRVRSLAAPIRVSEILQGRGGALFLDAFPRHDARKLAFTPFDRNQKTAGEDLHIALADLVLTRQRQIQFYLNTYGEPTNPAERPSDENLRRRKLIRDRHGNHLKLRTDDDIAAFLVSLFEDTIANPPAPPDPDALLDPSTSAPDAKVTAWTTVVDFLSDYVQQLTCHTRFNIDDRLKSYLQIPIPRAIAGGQLHDCGVYAVRLTYILHTFAAAVERKAPHTLDLVVSWFLLPLHVGLIVRNKLQLLIVHNDSLHRFPGKALQEWREEWSPPRSQDPDPPGPADLETKFIEDVAAAAFTNDLDMPLVRMNQPGVGVPKTKDIVWKSYLRLMGHERMFTDSLGPTFQFDLLYIQVMGIQRDWFNAFVVPLWNVLCPKIWGDFAKKMQTDFPANGPAYVQKLTDLLDAADNLYEDRVRPLKDELTESLRRNTRRLLQAGVRVNLAERLVTSPQNLGPLGEIKVHRTKIKHLLQPDPITHQIGLQKNPKTGLYPVPVPPFAEPDSIIPHLLN
jgi:hypothetical protein